MPKVFIVMMLAFMMTVSGIAPSFYAYAEDVPGEAVLQTEELAAPVPQEVTEVVKEEEPAPEPAPEPDPEPVKEEPAPSAETPVDNDVQSAGNTVSSNENDDVNKEVPGETGTAAEAEVPVPSGENAPAAAGEKDEEEKYPAQNFGDSTDDLDISVNAGAGVFPKGTKMKVRAASKAEVMDAAQRLTGKDAEIVDAAAADITFHHGGKEIQPKGSVNVNLTAKRALAGDSHEAVTVSDSGRASVMSGASVDSASFNTDHFTVYGIIGTDYEDDINNNVRYTYIFHVNNDVVSTQIIRKGEKVTVPASAGGRLCRWVDKDTGDEVTNDTAVPGGAREDRTINVTALFDCFHVIYHADSGAGTVCMTREAKDGDVVTLIKEEDKDFQAMHIVPEGESFFGWREADKTDKDIIASIKVEGKDIHLVPVFRKNIKVTLDANGGEFKTAGNGEAEAGTGTVVTLAVRPGDKIDLSDIPVRAGYKLREPAWYRNAEATDAWDPDNTVGADNAGMTLYAGWEEAENPFILSVMRENAQNDSYTEKEHSVWTSNNGTALKTGDPIPVGAILAQYGKDKYKSEHYHLNGTGAKQTDSRFKDSCPAVEIYHGGTKVAAFDFNGNRVEGDAAKAVIADKDTVVKVHYSLDSYQLYFRFDPDLSADDVPVNGHHGGTRLSRKMNATAYDDYRALMDTDWITGQSDQVLKYGEWMYTKACGNNPRIKKLLDEGTHWWFDAVYRGLSGQQVVFNASNMYNPFRPKEDTADGTDCLILVKYNSSQKAHQIIDVYYDGKGEERSRKDPITINYRTPRKHEFKLGSVVNGYELKEVTGPDDESPGNYRKLQAELQPNGQTKFTYLYDDDGEPLPMICHWYPAEYTITYVQVKTGTVDIADDCKEADQQHKVLFGELIAAAGAKPSGDNWKSIKDKNGIRFDLDEIEVYTQSGSKLDSIPENMPNSNLIVYYKWTPEKFRVIYDPDNGSPVIMDLDIPANGRTKGYQNVPGAEELEKEGFEFRGWYICDDQGKLLEPFDFSTKIRKNYFLKAVWATKDRYQVRYVTDERGKLPEGLVNGMDPKTFLEGSEAKIFGSAEPEKGKGLLFAGWAAGKEDGTVINGGRFTVTSGMDELDGETDHVITLVAQYAESDPKTRVTYHTNYPEGEGVNGKTFTTDPLAVNSSFRVLSIQETGWNDTYTFEGRTYKFVCWTNAKGEMIFGNSAERDYFYASEYAAGGRSDNDLYAVWRQVDEVKSDGVEPPVTVTVEPPGSGGTDTGVLGAYQDDTKPVKAKGKGVLAASEGVATGDMNIIAYLAVLIVLAAAGIAFILIRRRHDLHNNGSDRL